jgi:outer membrane protein insertion porin family
LREVKPYRIDAGVSYDSERGTGFISDIATQNRLGEARTLGFRTLVDRIRQEYRLYYSQPFLGTRRVTTTSAFTVEREKFDFYDFKGMEASLQLTAALSRRWRFSGGYTHNRGTIAGEFLFLPFLIESSWSAAVFSGSRDTRDEVLDATRGSFVSQAFEYGPQWLGGSIGYYRYYGQAFKYFPLRKPAVMPFAREKRPRWVFATGFRAGVQDGLNGSTILPSELFYAGGGTTVRGYERNSLGPRGEGAGSRDGSLGGRATLILNNELRFPVYKWLDGVAFHDAGNVFATPSQLSFGDLRQGAGFGLRIRNPFVLLRLDYGWKIGRRPGESAGAFFFSIGQAF